MKKGIKIFLFCFIIFATSFFGVNISNVDAKQISIASPITSTATTPPSSYDLRNYIDIGVENQNPYGICYAFASLTSLETYLALNYGEYYDFSEIHFALSLCLQEGYYSSVEQAFNSGGNFNHFTLYTQKDNNIVLEEEMPMSKYLKLNSSTKYTTMTEDYNNLNANYYPLVKVNDTVGFTQYAGNKSQYSSSELATFRNSVKTHIMQYGSVTAGIHTNSTFTNASINYKITDDSLVGNQSAITSNINHLISIVGWDDNYDANGTWANKGAYLCLNSWGTNFGLDGYFYVSYDDYFIESAINGVSNATLSTTNNKISTIANHQDKTYIVTHTLDNDLFLANIFDTSKYLGENITDIDVFAKGDTAKFYIKFFATKQDALAGLNSVTVMNLANSSKTGEFSLYYKYHLSTPLTVSGNYMVVVSQIDNAYKTHSLASATSTLEPTYYNTSKLGAFSTSTVWDPPVDNTNLSTALPIILHTDKQYIQVSKFTSNVDSIINSNYVKNNAIFYNKSINLTLNNANITTSNLANITITRSYINSFTDVSSNFNFSLSGNTITITMINDVAGSFSVGDYLIKIPCGNTTIYRVIEVQNAVSYSITYHLNGGSATNPNVYTNKHTTLILNSPTKAGYEFVGWYTDSTFNTQFDPDNLPYTSLELYAKYDFATPTIASKTNDISITYYDGIKVDIIVNATHALLNEYNTLSYQWYMRKTLSDMYSIIDGATSSTLSVYNVRDSGYYVCEISISITDLSLTASTIVKTLTISNTNEIAVNIKPYIYDMSNAKWNYSEALSYNASAQTVEVINLPQGVTIQYSNNEFSDIGTYIAHAELVYDDMDGNAYASPIDDLNWEIRKSRITITINDIISNEPISLENLNNMYTCSIENEYLPSTIVTYQDKLEYLDLVFDLQDTAQPNIKTITATTKTFDIYDITIIDAQYRVVVYTLTSNNITSTNQNGFVADCKFTAENIELGTETNDILKQQDLNLIGSYNISYSYLQESDKATVNIPLERKTLLNNLTVYMLKDNKLFKVDNVVVNSDGITFDTDEQNATYIIVKNNNSLTSNTQMLILICIIGVFVILCVFAIVVAIKRKHLHNI